MGRASITVPPAPAETPTGETVSNPNPDEPTDQEIKPVIEPAPLEMPMDEEPIAVPVPVPESGTEIIIEDGGTLRSKSNSGADTDETSEPIDFSMARWYSGHGGMTWMPGHRDRFGMFSLTSDTPSKWKDWGGVASGFGYGFHFLNGPVSSDLPSKLFDFSWGLVWSGEITEGFSASLAGKVGVYSDFEDSVRDGWRFPAHAVFFRDWDETFQGVLGVNFLDRRNLPVLPVVGVVLRPDDRLRLEAIFPEPRIAWRVHRDESLENWVSLSGQIGGGEWAIERSNTDLADVVTYNDYSAVLGFHTKIASELRTAFEIGYTFARDLEYRSKVGNFEPDETFFFRMSHGF